MRRGEVSIALTLIIFIVLSIGSLTQKNQDILDRLDGNTTDKKEGKSK